MSAPGTWGCWACLRLDVRKRPGRGKQYYRHLCPHGVPCVSGSTLMGLAGMNGPARGGEHYCPACVEAYTAYWNNRRSN